MKVRFLSKEQRIRLKQEKQKSYQKTVQIYLPQPLKPSATIPSSMTAPILAQKLNKQIEQSRNLYKCCALGQLKQAKNDRHNKNYRNQLKFQWDKSDDTSKPYLLQNKAKVGKESTQLTRNKTHGQMTDRDWKIFREDNKIETKGVRVPHPFRNWHQSSLNPNLISRLQKIGFVQPKAIQMQAIPIGLCHKDLLGIAPTGEGKTLAYLIPIIEFIMPLPRIDGRTSDKGPYALVLVPSRELAEQIQAQFQRVNADIKCIILIGGHQIEMQSLELSAGCQVVVGTPGRIREMMDKNYLSFQRLSWVVIDQADKMINENLVEEVQYILDRSGSEALCKTNEGNKKVISMFSATMVPEIEKLAKTHLSRQCIQLNIGDQNVGKKEIQQHVEFCTQQQKGQILRRLLNLLPPPIIVFVNTRQKCEKLWNRIQKGFQRSCAEYHGGKNQEQRERAIASFRKKQTEILVATDLAGRGLDVQNITAVINYDAPKNITEFIHRTGRTARAGMTGKAFTMLTSEDQPLFYDLKVFLERNQFRVPKEIKDCQPAHLKNVNVPRRKQIVYTN